MIHIQGSNVQTVKLNPANTFSIHKLQFVDAGSDTIVYEHPTQPNKVIKIGTITTTQQSGPLQFIKLALLHQDNPCFPKIYKTKLYSQVTGDILFVLMERLIDLKTLPNINNVLTTTLGLDDNDLLHIIKQNPTFRNHKLSVDTPTFELTWKALYSTPQVKLAAEMTTNTLLKQAFLHLLQVPHAGDTINLTIDNMMIRTTPSGPQLVIVDPFYYDTIDE